MLVASLLVFAGLSASPGRSSAFFVVDDPGTQPDANVGDEMCRTAANTCTLRAAIEQANVLPLTDHIQVPLQQIDPFSFQLTDPTYIDAQGTRVGSAFDHPPVTFSLSSGAAASQIQGFTLWGGVDASGADGILLRFNDFQVSFGIGPGPAVRLDGVTGGTIEQNQFNGGWPAGVVASGGTTGVTVANNQIQTDSAIGVGLDLSGATAMTIAGNTILGHLGIRACCSTSDGHEISANELMVGSGIGVWLDGSGSNYLSQNQITAFDAGIRISGPNGRDNAIWDTTLFGGSPGIRLDANAGVGNEISRTTYLGPTLAIDLPGVVGASDPNDPGDADVGANQLQNWPRLDRAETVAGGADLTVTLTNPASTYTVQVFRADNCSPGQTEGASVFFLTAAEGLGSSPGDTFTIHVPGAQLGWHLMATATDSSGNTSEYSPCEPVVAGADAGPPTVGPPSLSVNPVVQGGSTIVTATASDDVGVYAAEAFFGSDPGQGSGTPMQVGSGSISATLTAPATAGSYTVSVRARDAAGNWSVPQSAPLTVQAPGGTETASQSVPPGGAITTDPANAGVSPDNPVATTIVLPSGGTGGQVTITESPVTAPPTGPAFTLFGQQVVVTTGVSASPTNPIRLYLFVDHTIVPTGEDVLVFRDGVLVAPCDPTQVTAAVPAPCVEPASTDAHGDFVLAIRTDHFSTFTLGFSKLAFTGFFAPVDNPPTKNSVKAGAAVPVRFSLGGDFGSGIFAAGSPTTQTVNCSTLTSAPTDAIEETVTANESGLSYSKANGVYTYTWKSQKSWTGCRELTLRFVDGTKRVAYFQLTK
jgi:hypothetical protein